jgi:hypothetical protein
MQPTPLRKYRIPGYPTRLEVLEQPELLERHLPPGWRATAEMAGLAGVFLALNSTLRAEEPKQPAKPEAAIVAPIFEHGEGRGVDGCVAIAPPVFLSEEEAMQIIAEELSRAKIDVSKRDIALSGVTIPLREWAFGKEGGKLEWQIREVRGEVLPLEVDILDDEHNVAVEFVSHSDYYKVGGARENSTIEQYAFKEVAGYIARQASKKGKGVRIGIFYDPLTPYNPKAVYEEKDLELLKQKFEELRTSARTESKRLLRLQVKDFIDWLKGQGVI